MKKHFVTFYSPGTFFNEQSTLEIDEWDVDKAVDMAHDVVERYDAKPYGFQFTTRERGPEDFDSKETKRSNMYYLGGQIKTLAEVKAENNPDNKILISNMECNGWNKIIINTNSWRYTAPLNKDDVVLNVAL